MPTTDQTNERIQITREIYNDALNDIELDATLSDLGKQQRTAAAYVKAATRLKELRNDAREQNTRTRRDLERTLFGLATGSDATTTINLRDAEDRADKATTPEEATELMARALRGGDIILANAVAAVAFNKSQTPALGENADKWGVVLDPWMDERPEVEDLLVDLIEVRRPGRRIDTILDSSLLRPPAPLSGLLEHQIRDLASGGDGRPAFSDRGVNAMTREA